MNHREEPMTTRTRKKVRKAVRSAMESETAPPSPRNLRGQNLAKPSAKKTTQTASRVAKLKKTIKIKVKKSLSAKSKRTSPGKVEGQPSGPAYPNKEGKRWMQTVEKQTLSRSRTLGKKLSKKR